MSEKVWCVGVVDCENNSTIAICATKETAIRIMFERRDVLVAEYKNHLAQGYGVGLYEEMIQRLSGDDWEKWDTYPHEKPYIYEAVILP